jgi:hypothetical protein
LNAFRLPFGAPIDGPPCILHLPFAIAGDWHGYLLAFSSLLGEAPVDMRWLGCWFAEIEISWLT